MKGLRFLIPAVLVVCSAAMADVQILQFQAFAQIDRARLQWTTGNETSFDKFVIERSDDGSTYYPVGIVQSTGSFSEYTFSDGSPLDADMDHTFYYRLKMINDDGTFRYSDVLDVSLTFSAVQQTWGSIKAMFR